MATVQSKTNVKLDELINATVVSGYLDGSGNLILVTRGGAEIAAGSVSAFVAELWSSSIAYKTGSIVGYAGQTWRAIGSSTNKVPALNADVWKRINGRSSSTWVDRDPYFENSVLTSDWNTFWKTGTSIVSLTTNPSEIETGKQAAKIVLSASSSQRLYSRDENIVRGGEVITLKVRAKLVSAAAGATITAQLIQNPGSYDPVPLATGNVYTSPDEGVAGLTTAWATYTFTFTTANASPRAMVNVVLATNASGSATFLIDSVTTDRALEIETPINYALLAHPIGSVFISVVDTDPAELLGGGTWSRIAQGRMLIGQSSSDTDFDTAEETGGEKTHTLTVAEMPTHNHSASALTVPTREGDNLSPAPNSTSSVWSNGNSKLATSGGASGTTQDRAWISGSVGNAGSGDPHNNMPPYFVTYIWKRTA